MNEQCRDCGCDLGERGKNHEYCTRCIAQWYANLDPSEVPNGDFDDTPKPEY